MEIKCKLLQSSDWYISSKQMHYKQELFNEGYSYLLFQEKNLIGLIILC